MATIKKNITVEKEVYDNFIKIAEQNGIKFSTWINLQLKRFVEKNKEDNL